MEQAIYPLNNESEQALFYKISKELKCMVCQNQSLFDSKAPLALALRQQIYQQVREGKQEQEIIDFVIQQHGSVILYRPLLSPGTYLLWAGPLLMVILGVWCFRKLLVK